MDGKQADGLPRGALMAAEAMGREVVKAYLCRCGVVFPPRCGAYGCPNCHGGRGPAALMSLVAKRGAWPSIRCAAVRCRYCVGNGGACLLDSRGVLEQGPFLRAITAVRGRWKLAPEHARQKAEGGRGSGATVAGALMDRAVIDVQSGRVCPGALVELVSAMCEDYPVGSLRQSEKARAVAGRLRELLPTLRAMNLDVSAKVLWRSLWWAARHGLHGWSFETQASVMGVSAARGAMDNARG